MKTLLFLLFASGSALADNAALLHCRTISDAGQRLACYDAMAVTAPVAAKKAAEQSFGLAPKREKEQSIMSTVVGKFAGEPREQIELANGQVWRVIDDSIVFETGSNLKVKINRNYFGNTFMEIEGTNVSPKVQRVK